MTDPSGPDADGANGVATWPVGANGGSRGAFPEGHVGREAPPWSGGAASGAGDGARETRMRAAAEFARPNATPG